MEQLTFCAPCLFGLEGILGDELKRMGAADVRPENGRVLFAGGTEMLARANIASRYAERICVVMGSFAAHTFEELFTHVRALPWERWIGSKDAFPVKGWSLNSILHSVPDCQSIIKKAIVERLKGVYRLDWFEETGALCRVQFSILKDEVTVMLDTSGDGLHKRGYRRLAGDAPIRETLAAAMADVTRVRRAERVLDPCCGSGTLLIESLLAARGIAPGKNRRFSAMNWASVPSDIWGRERERAVSLEHPENRCTAWGGDVDEACLRLARDNAALAGVGDALTAARQDLRQFRPEGDTGVVLCNPPYGERLLDVRAAEELYRVMGQVFRPKTGWSYAIISPHEDFERLFGRKATKRRKMYNGMIKCQLFMYF